MLILGNAHAEDLVGMVGNQRRTYNPISFKFIGCHSVGDLSLNSGFGAIKSSPTQKSNRRLAMGIMT